MKKKIYIVDDDENILKFIKFALKEYKVKTFTEPREFLKALDLDPPDVIISDMVMPEINGIEILKRVKKTHPSIPVLIITAYSTVENAVESMKLGAFDYIVKPLNAEDLKIRVQKALDTSKLRSKVEEINREYKRIYSLDSIVGKSKFIYELKKTIQRINEIPDATVLLSGESGTGKNLISRVIHYTGPRSEAKYVEINCASIPENLIESELFGYEKGAFTDAKSTKKGLFEIADGGTVLLDEIGAINTALQAKLLSVIETKTFRRIGGLDDINVDIRIITATNLNLDEAVTEGKFREDLYFRINLISIKIPPLRERREDILPLAYHFIDELNPKLKRNISGLTPDAEKMLVSHTWPGNVRELLNTIERAMIFVDPDKRYLTSEDLTSVATQTIGKAEYFAIPKGLTLKEAEKEYIKSVLEWTDYDYNKTAKILGISVKTLWEKRKKYGLG